MSGDRTGGGADSGADAGAAAERRVGHHPYAELIGLRMAEQHAGLLNGTTEMVNRGKTVANLESRLFVDDRLVASANGNYSIFRLR